MMMTLDGVVLPMARYYSSLDAAVPGTFGYGWQLAGADPQITSDVPLTGAEAQGVYNPLQLGSRVYLNLPDGSRVGFTFTPTPQVQPGLIEFQPLWTTDPGTSYKLASAPAALEQVNGGFYQIGTGLPYNPSSGQFAGTAYTLTAPDGTQYDYSPTGRLLQMVGPAGQVLLWSDSGVLVPDGEQLAFQHDAAGRLMRVTAPDGTQVVYTYDTTGNLTEVLDLPTDVRTQFSYAAGHVLLPTFVPPAGFVAGQSPTVAPGTAFTESGFATTVNLAALAHDPQGRSLSFVLSNAQGGQAILEPDAPRCSLRRPPASRERRRSSSRRTMASSHRRRPRSPSQLVRACCRISASVSKTRFSIPAPPQR